MCRCGREGFGWPCYDSGACYDMEAVGAMFQRSEYTLDLSRSGEINGSDILRDVITSTSCGSSVLQTSSTLLMTLFLARIKNNNNTIRSYCNSCFESRNPASS